MATRTEYSARPNRESLSKRLGKLARQIKARDGHRCVYCGATAVSSGTHLHLDHLVPRSLGGLDHASNLVLACKACNCARKVIQIDAWCELIGVDVAVVVAQANKELPRAA